MKDDVSRKLSKGYIGLFRSIQDHWLWDDKPVSRGQAWVDMLLWASHKDRETPVTDGFVQIKTGQFIRTLRQMGEAWGWSTSKVQRFLSMLQEANMIRNENDTRTTHVSILKYETYRELTMSSDTRTRQERDKVETKSIHNKELKRIKKNLISRQTNFESEVMENKDKYSKDMLINFIQYWTEPNKSKSKMRFEMEKTWDTSRRLATWEKRSKSSFTGTNTLKPPPPAKHKYICLECDRKVESEKDSWQVQCNNCGPGTMVTPHEYPYMKKTIIRR